MNVVQPSSIIVLIILLTIPDFSTGRSFESFPKAGEAGYGKVSAEEQSASNYYTRERRQVGQALGTVGSTVGTALQGTGAVANSLLGGGLSPVRGVAGVPAGGLGILGGGGLLGLG